ncbi:MAG: ribonuclease R [Bacilli bacterium]|nr:ribonuclease R [Bacilli bacterium]MDD4282308.1 ribonuclease R [Bacilli bacterium]MDD4718759.1 ribonuclease R [Bacilli bacterium]
MHDKILEILKNENKAISATEINNRLELTSIDEFKEVLKILVELEDNLKVYRTKKDNYMLFDNSHLRVGRLIVNKKGFGFVDIAGDEDIYIHGSNMNGAIHDDKVVTEIIHVKGMEMEGRIVRVVERKLKQLVGEFYYKKGKGYIDLDDEKVKINIEIDKNRTLGAMNGHKVLVRITNRINNNNYRGEVIKIIGHKNDPGVDVMSIAMKYDINDVFPDEVIIETEKIRNEVTKDEMIGRKDLRNQIIFTIDGSDTKDIDDALSLKLLDNGNYLLGVHIADVSYYVKENSRLDEEAFERGTSVYLADRVIPMLPHKLSNGICSLNPNVDRLAVSCVMEINDKGNVINYDIFESVIKSKKQMTYDSVNQILEDNNTPEGYEDYVEILNQMKDLSLILRKNKDNRGFIDFEIDESKIVVNDEGDAIDVVLRNRGVGEKLIEDFMIVANETVASAIFFMELPFVYRIHGKPNEEKVNNFLDFIKVLGYKVDIKKNNYDSKTMQNILESLKDKKEFLILSKLMLRSMQKAVYDKNNIGHFGIASKCYTHFTSPIRRYPDTTVHRLLRTYLFNNKMDKDTINYWDNRLVFLTEHTSKKERDSIECEREVTDMKKAEYMMKHIGERYSGIVSSVMSFGMFIELPNLVEGLIRVDDLIDDHYVFDETTFSLRGDKNKRGYRLGDIVNIIVKNASKEAKTIDFVIDYENKVMNN